jgi:hypothetical protein
VPPREIAAFAGVIDTATGLITLKVVELEMELKVPEMVVVPCPELVARP